MRVLVIEDNQVHIDAAKKHLAGDDNTICSLYREAEKVLAGAEYGCNYAENAEFPFDAVLTDLFLPPSPIGTVTVLQYEEDEEQAIARDLSKAIEKFGEEIPYGLVIALASMRRGVPVAIVSDANHHGHPISWALDLVVSHEQKRLLFGTSPFLTMEGCYVVERIDGQRVKRWDKMLDLLMKENGHA